MSPGIYVHRKVGPGLLPKTEHEAKQTNNGAPRKHGPILSHGAVESNSTGVVSSKLCLGATDRPARHDEGLAAHSKKPGATVGHSRPRRRFRASVPLAYFPPMWKSSPVARRFSPLNRLARDSRARILRSILRKITIVLPRGRAHDQCEYGLGVCKSSKNAR
jgi:hypothetical protein